MQQNYYAILKVSKNASQADIKKAYKKLAFKYHPDRNKKRGAKELFQKLAEAYAVLSDVVSRRKYDATINDILRVDEEVNKETKTTKKVKRRWFKTRLSISRLTHLTKNIHNKMHIVLTRSVPVEAIARGDMWDISFTRFVRCKNCDYDGLVKVVEDGKERTKVCSKCSGTTLRVVKESVEVDLREFKMDKMYTFKKKGHHGGVYGGKYDKTKNSERFLGNLYLFLWAT